MSHTFASRVSKFVDLPHEKRLLLLEAVGLVLLARVAILFLPFRWIATWLGDQKSHDCTGQDGGDTKNLRQIQWAVGTASRHVPWQAKCLVQAMAARSMLARRGIQGIVYLGVAKDARQDLIAHAWVRSGGRFVTGAAGHPRFTVVSCFRFGKAPRHS